MLTHSKITVRPLTEPDFGLLFVWLNEPHLYPFYQQEPVTAEYVEQRYGSRFRSNGPTNSMIAQIDGTPFGYVQWYLNRAYPDYGVATLGEPGGVSFDYYVGSREHLGRHLVSDIFETAFQQLIPKIEAPDRLIFVSHRSDNFRAASCSKRAGFSVERAHVEDGHEKVLLCRDER